MVHKTMDKKFLCFRYERQGDVSCFSVFGFHIYEHVGDVRALFGMAWGANNG